MLKNNNLQLSGEMKIIILVLWTSDKQQAYRDIVTFNIIKTENLL